MIMIPIVHLKSLIAQNLHKQTKIFPFCRFNSNFAQSFFNIGRGANRSSRDIMKLLKFGRFPISNMTIGSNLVADSKMLAQTRVL